MSTPLIADNQVFVDLSRSAIKDLNKATSLKWEEHLLTMSVARVYRVEGEFISVELREPVIPPSNTIDGILNAQNTQVAATIIHIPLPKYLTQAGVDVVYQVEDDVWGLPNL